ncbi:MAG: hypothetical protein ABR981_00865 [Candidatus Micrarchaeaceae archaeon]|jgi:hypothetical protein
MSHTNLYIKRNEIGDVPRKTLRQVEMMHDRSRPLALRQLPYMLNYTNEEEKRRIERELIRDHLLRRDTEVKGSLERVFKVALLMGNIAALYEPLEFPPIILNTTTLFYRPDFLIPCRSIKGKPIILEPHDPEKITRNYLNKLKSFRERYNLYIVLATAKDELVMPAKEERIRQHVDDFWPLDMRSSIVKQDAAQKISLLLNNAERRQVFDSGLTRILELLRNTSQSAA